MKPGYSTHLLILALLSGRLYALVGLFAIGSLLLTAALCYLQSQRQMDARVRQLSSLIDLGIGEIASSLGRKLHELIDEYSDELSDLTERRRGIESAIESFCLINKGEFGKKRSRQFHFGRISFRMAERIEIPEELEDAVISTLKKLGFSDCVETRERRDRNALKKLSDSDLTRCGIRRTK